MDSSASSIPSRLEILPDEILLQIFKYIKPTDLRSFLGHNQRINNVIKDVKLNMIIQYPEEEEEGDEEAFDYLKSFPPNQFIRLELRYRWETFNLNVYKELRSLKLDCNCLSEDQFDQVLTVNLPHLERFSMDNVPHFHGMELLLVTLDKEHYPSLKVCQFSGELHYQLEFNENYRSPNDTIRTLILNCWDPRQFGALLKLLPNLRRFETSFLEPINGSLNANMHHIPLEYLRITLKEPSDDLEEMLPYIPNLKQLYITGKINEESAFGHFKKLIKIFRSYTPNLQKFNCELYFHAWNGEDDIIDIQQLHPLFKKIVCHSGSSINKCYATDLSEYPQYSEYSYVDRRRSDTPVYCRAMGGYDSDRDWHNDYDDDDDNDGFVNYGLGYRGNYKANYGSSPWSGNND